jgi:TRAP-type uncharacterized transport system fused permease subunit
MIALFLISLGIVGYLRGPLNLLERALLIVIACVMVVDPLELTLAGLAPAVAGAAIAARHWIAYAKTATRGAVHV